MTRFALWLALRQFMRASAFLAQNADLLADAERSKLNAQMNWTRDQISVARQRPQR